MHYYCTICRTVPRTRTPLRTPCARWGGVGGEGGGQHYKERHARLSAVRNTCPTAVSGEGCAHASNCCSGFLSSCGGAAANSHRPSAATGCRLPPPNSVHLPRLPVLTAAAHAAACGHTRYVTLRNVEERGRMPHMHILDLDFDLPAKGSPGATIPPSRWAWRGKAGGLNETCCEDADRTPSGAATPPTASRRHLLRRCPNESENGRCEVAPSWAGWSSGVEAERRRKGGV